MPRLIEAVQSAGQIVTWVCDPMHGNTECVAGYKTRRYERIRQEVCLHVWRFEPVSSLPGSLWCMHAYSNTGQCIMIHMIHRVMDLPACTCTILSTRIYAQLL